MDTLHKQSLVQSERTNFTQSIQLPVASLTLRPDQWILIEEALLEQSAILYHISDRNYRRGDHDQAIYLWDKQKELETLANKVADVIESLQAKANSTVKEND